ncbi:MAG TPA: polyprenyl synthetase family protein [Egibacteraceae bacterium]|nr:polyprenyl synthetase family protein [Egibacteraceae bacterium]
MPPPAAAGPTALEAARAPVEAVLRAYLAQASARLAALDPALADVATPAVELALSGGKRLRPAFVHWGARAAGAALEGELGEAVHTAGAAVELLHTFALVHDDVMDRAQWRRGRPALHRAMAEWHAAEGLVGDAGWFGIGAAILAGDIVFVWADELFDRAAAAVAEPAAAREVFTRLRVEVMAGQYLDLRLAGLPRPTAEEALRVALLKSGRYTVTRPLQLGAALGGAGSSRPGDALGSALSAYGDALGVAFQLRDDVLGLYGDPAATGKEALGDLREGKRTLLVLRALELAGDRDRAAVAAALGDPALDHDGADRVRRIVRDTGALAAVEREMEQRLAEAVQALAAVPEPARSALAELARDSVHRLA